MLGLAGSCLAETAINESNLYGTWKIKSLIQNGVDLSEGENLTDYWKFNQNGSVEFGDAQKGPVSSTYELDGNILKIKSKDWRPDGQFTVKKLDANNLQWEIEIMGGILTYNLVPE